MRKVLNAGMLECVLCSGHFNEQDVRECRYFPSTQVCLRCYRKGQASPYGVWCFGKRNVQTPSGKVLEYGFDLEARACREECPDRKICQLFVAGELGEKMSKKASSQELVCPFKQSHSMTAKAWMMCATKGVMIKDLVRWVEKQGGEPHRVLRIMRSGHYLNVRWLVDEQNGFLKITYRDGDSSAKN
jgi:hypothetical protein